MNKGDLIGGTFPKIGGGSHEVNTNTILERNFELPDSVSFMFCSGCDSLYELSKHESQDLGERVGKQLSHNNEYFETSGCPQCGGHTGSVEIKEASLN